MTISNDKVSASPRSQRRSLTEKTEESRNLCRKSYHGFPYSWMMNASSIPSPVRMSEGERVPDSDNEYHVPIIITIGSLSQGILRVGEALSGLLTVVRELHAECASSLRGGSEDSRIAEHLLKRCFCCHEISSRTGLHRYYDASTLCYR